MWRFNIFLSVQMQLYLHWSCHCNANVCNINIEKYNKLYIIVLQTLFVKNILILTPNLDGSV